MTAQEIWSNSSHDHGNLWVKVRLMEGTFLILRAIIEVKSDPEGGCCVSFPGGLTDGLIPLCSPMGEERWRHFSWTLSNFAVVAPPRSEKKQQF